MTQTCRNIRSHLAPSSQTDAAELPSTPKCSFRETITTAAERLGQPVAKRKAVSGQSHTRRRKIKEHKALNDSWEKDVHANRTRDSKLESYGSCKEDDSRHEAANQGLPTALSKKTLDRLDVFRCQLPQNAATQTSNCERNTMQKALLINGQPSNDTVPPDKNHPENYESQRSNRLMNSVESLEPTLPPEHDLLGQSGGTRNEHLLSGKSTDSSSSSFEADDFDQTSLEDAFHAAEDDIYQHLHENAYPDDLISNPDAQHKFSPSDSDFGSDPFEPDHAESQNELHQPSSDLFNSSGPRTCQAADHDFSKPWETIQTSRPPSYQTPRKSPPTTNQTPTDLQTRPPTTPASPTPTRNELSPQQQPNSPTPFLRPTFPPPVPPDSPISNVTRTTRILTCFRTAEYLRAISATKNAHTTLSSSSSSSNLIIELYATVTSSTRTNDTQHFTFSDLFFPHRPPHLHGTWCGTWQGSDLFEDDTRTFLSAGKAKGRGKMCRAVVRAKGGGSGKVAAMVGSSAFGEGGLEPEGGGLGWEGKGESVHEVLGQVLAEVEVLNVWEADWEDVEYVRGIVSA